MTLKKIGIILYVLSIVFITYFVATLSEASKVVDFLSDQQTTLLSNDDDLLLASVMASHHDGSDAYTLSMPLFEETFTNTDHNIRVSIYPIAVFNDKTSSNMLAILAKDIQIENDQAELDENDFHVMSIDIVFDRPIAFSDQTQNEFTEEFPYIFEDRTRLFLIDLNKIMTITGQAVFTSIDISYKTTGDSQQILVGLTNGLLSDVIVRDPFDIEFNRDISAITTEATQLIEMHGVDNFEDNTQIYYNDVLLQTLKHYNWYFFEYIAIELVMVSVISYFLFFHKIVKKRLRIKKDQKHKEEQERYNQIRNELSQPNAQEINREVHEL